jgi:hypothetical protein
LKLEIDIKAAQNDLRIVGIVISIVSALSGGIVLELLEVVSETHDD